MGFFERPDPRLAQSADPTPAGAVGRALARHTVALGVCFIAVIACYAANLIDGLHEAAATRGNAVAPGTYQPVTILRDRRGVAHIRARNEHDLYFAEGYVQASDRLFQLDLSRRYAYGTLAEVIGAKALPYDEIQRAVDIQGIAQRQLRALAPRDRAAIAAFSAGVNAAAASQPLPVEFRMLLYRPAPWMPQDTLAVSIVASLELADSWRDVVARDSVWRARGARCFDALYPLSDPRYDVTIAGVSSSDSPASPPPACSDTEIAARAQRLALGSNAWAAGADRSAGGHALVANDPHLDLTIPGIWYLVDLQSPGLHAAGATIPGLPGVVLGHNEHVAWASTNAAMATTGVFSGERLRGGTWVSERFHVRLSRDVRVRYYRTAREYSVPDDSERSGVALVRWPVYAESRSTIATALDLDRAQNVAGALRAIANYGGSPQNFIVADVGGSVAYHVAGLVPNDPAWGRYVHGSRDLARTYPPVPFARLPAQAPGRGGVLVSANNKPYGAEYPYRLSAQFEPPYRAHRIAQLLGSRRRFDVTYFARMQLDTLSPIDLEIAHRLSKRSRSGELRELRAWDGRYAPRSQAATIEHELRLAVFQEGPAFSARLTALRAGAGTSDPLEQDLSGALSLLAFERARAWRDAGAMRVEHLLAPLNFPFLDGAWLPGEGDEYTIHLQEAGIAQGFRAVWEVGAWDRGGIAIPSGESGEPGSGHYTDLTRDWIAGALRPLPFGRDAVDRDAATILVLRPRYGLTR
jgi:penicillin amidase